MVTLMHLEILSEAIMFSSLFDRGNAYTKKEMSIEQKSLELQFRAQKVLRGEAAKHFSFVEEPAQTRTTTRAPHWNNAA